MRFLNLSPPNLTPPQQQPQNVHPPPKIVPVTPRTTKTVKNMHAQQPMNVKPIIDPTVEPDDPREALLQ